MPNDGPLISGKIATVTSNDVLNLIETQLAMARESYESHISSRDFHQNIINDLNLTIEALSGTRDSLIQGLQRNAVQDATSPLPAHQNRVTNSR